MHNNCALAPEKIAIAYDMLADYYKKVGDEYGIKYDNVKKLIPNLGNKPNYVVYFRNFQLCLS